MANHWNIRFSLPNTEIETIKSIKDIIIKNIHDDYPDIIELPDSNAWAYFEIIEGDNESETIFTFDAKYAVPDYIMSYISSELGLYIKFSFGYEMWSYGNAYVDNWEVFIIDEFDIMEMQEEYEFKMLFPWKYKKRLLKKHKRDFYTSNYVSKQELQNARKMKPVGKIKRNEAKKLSKKYFNTYFSSKEFLDVIPF